MVTSGGFTPVYQLTGLTKLWILKWHEIGFIAQFKRSDSKTWCYAKFYFEHFGLQSPTCL